MPYEEARERLLGMGIPEERAQAFWAVIQPNLTKVGDAAEWWRIVAGEVTPVIADAGFAAAALDVLPSEPWDGQTWKAWTNAVKERTGAKGKALFMPLRLAVTGLEHGPDLSGLLPLIGRDIVAARLGGRD